MFQCSCMAQSTSDRELLTLPEHTHTHIHTHPFNGPFSGTTRVGRYQKGKTNLDFTEARDSEWQWHQLGHMQVCTSLPHSTSNTAVTFICTHVISWQLSSKHIWQIKVIHTKAYFPHPQYAVYHFAGDTHVAVSCVIAPVVWSDV